MEVCVAVLSVCGVFLFKQKTAYEMRSSDWSSDVCSSELAKGVAASADRATEAGQEGRELVEASIQSMGAGKEQTELMAENVLGLAEQAQSIGADRKSVV